MILSESFLLDFSRLEIKRTFDAYIVHSPSAQTLFSYGLAGAVISNDEERCERISKVTESGSITWTLISPPDYLQGC
jgi:hypothetical protein